MAKTIEPAGPSRARRKPAESGDGSARGRGGKSSGKSVGNGATRNNTGSAAASRQAGGTVLGIIIGLIVGLGIAVVVAVMITKSTLPFTNKQAQPERPAGVTNSGQIVDPNKPLYGKQEAAREAAKNLKHDAVPENTVTADTKPPGAEATAAEKAAARAADKEAARAADILAGKPSPADKAVADARQAERANPRADKAADKPTDKLATARPDAADEKWIYYLQAGAFRESTDAENAKAKLALMGFEANVSERPSDSGPLYRVRIGPFNQLEVMTRARSKLSDNGVDVAVVRTAR